jgi:NTP pyrophosphatase (non-canonical NTP hydrolase)
MTLEEYRRKVTEQAVYPGERGLEYVLIGLVGEAGELANDYKKFMRRSERNLDAETRDKLVDELGDVFWYAFAMCEELGVDPSEVLRRNVQKLEKRHANASLKTA